MDRKKGFVGRKKKIVFKSPRQWEFVVFFFLEYQTEQCCYRRKADAVQVVRGKEIKIKKRAKNTVSGWLSYFQQFYYWYVGKEKNKGLRPHALVSCQFVSSVGKYMIFTLVHFVLTTQQSKTSKLKQTTPSKQKKTKKEQNWWSKRRNHIVGKLVPTNCRIKRTDKVLAAK